MHFNMVHQFSKYILYKKIITSFFSCLFSKKKNPQENRYILRASIFYSPALAEAGQVWPSTPGNTNHLHWCQLTSVFSLLLCSKGSTVLSKDDQHLLILAVWSHPVRFGNHNSGFLNQESIHQVNAKDHFHQTILCRINKKRLGVIDLKVDRISINRTLVQPHLNFYFLTAYLFAVELCDSLHCCHIYLRGRSPQTAPEIRGFLGALAYHHLLWGLEFPVQTHLLNLLPRRIATTPEIVIVQSTIIYTLKTNK